MEVSDEDIGKLIELLESYGKCPESKEHKWETANATKDVTTLKCAHCGDVKTIGCC